MKTVTTDTMMSYRPCGSYPRVRVVELWSGRDALTAQQIADLDIPQQDRIWALCAWLARMDRASLSAFARGRADAAKKAAAAADYAASAHCASAASARAKSRAEAIRDLVVRIEAAFLALAVS